MEAAPAMDFLYVCACQATQSCLTLSEPMDCSLPGPSVHGIFQTRILEWLPFPSPGDLLDPKIEAMSPILAGRFFTTVPPGKPSFLFFFFFEGLKLEPDMSTTTQRGFHAVNAGGPSQGDWGRPHPMHD